LADEGETRRTVLPPAEAEGAGNFAAEPGLDPTAGPGDTAVAIEMEMGTLSQKEDPSAAGEEGNRTGGEPAEEVVERRADSEAEVVRLVEVIEERDEAAGLEPDRG
jgi:hypothetical protein